MSNWSWIITAGGIGKRMGSVIPKQFLELNGIPILMHTMERVKKLDPNAELLLTLPEDYHSFWKELCDKHTFTLQHQVVPGGTERYHSIKAALQFVNRSVVAVHDGVRPFIGEEMYLSLLKAIPLHKALIPLVPLTESLRELTPNSENLHSTKACIRSNYRTVQTPQVFDRQVLTEAYVQEYTDHITDDASLVEQINVPIHWVEGHFSNIKITTPLDLHIAQFILSEKTY